MSVSSLGRKVGPSPPRLPGLRPGAIAPAARVAPGEHRALPIDQGKGFGPSPWTPRSDAVGEGVEVRVLAR